MDGKYEVKNWASYRHEKEGPALMANFCAEIVKETRYEDGANSQTILTLRGQMPPPPDGEDPIDLPAVELTAEEFAAMGWVMRKWGARCIIVPGGSVKDDLRAMIQMRSQPPVTTVYRSTGWHAIGKRRVYLHAGGGISATGDDPSITVQLPPELARYDLTAARDVEPAEGLSASLDLLSIAPLELTWPLLAATLAPLYGPCDFGIHLTGRTGSFKSELLSLFQSHYGPGMDARHLPGSWSSSANALEALAYYAKDAAFTIDDFVPQGSSYQQRQYQANADRIIRAQGNQAGRARLSDAASLQQTMYPRGVVLSTGEDTPEGHSVRARLLIAEIAAGTIDPDSLSVAQRARPYYCGTVAWLARSLAQEPTDLRTRTEQIRSEQRTLGHARTPGIVGRLIATAEDVIRRAVADGLLDPREADAHARDAVRSILAAGARQSGFLEDTDPVDVFRSAIRQAVGSGGGHFRSLSGGVPKGAEVLGWTAERTMGEMKTYKSRGPCMGWVNWSRDELYLDVTAGFNIVKKAAGTDLALSKQTLFKRLKDAGALGRVDEARNRNTVRITAEQHPRQVLCLFLAATLDLKEVPDEDDDSEDPRDDEPEAGGDADE